MGVVKVRYSLISLISYFALLLFGLYISDVEADNTTNIQTVNTKSENKDG